MFGKEIKEARKTIGATQSQVAKATGIPQNTISWIESDKGIPNVWQCLLIAKYLGCSIEYLIGSDDNFNNSQIERHDEKILEKTAKDINEENILKTYRSLSERDKLMFMRFIGSIDLPLDKK